MGIRSLTPQIKSLPKAPQTQHSTSSASSRVHHVPLTGVPRCAAKRQHLKNSRCCCRHHITITITTAATAKFFFPKFSCLSKIDFLVVIWSDRTPKISPHQFLISPPPLNAIAINAKLAKPSRTISEPSHDGLRFQATLKHQKYPL